MAFSAVFIFLTLAGLSSLLPSGKRDIHCLHPSDIRQVGGKSCGYAADHEPGDGIIAYLLVSAIIISAPPQQGGARHLCSRMGFSPTPDAQEDLEFGICRHARELLPESWRVEPNSEGLSAQEW